MPTFRNKSGLTAYAFGCGYIQRFELLDDAGLLSIDLWHEGACFHIRATVDSARREWISVHHLTVARGEWRRLIRELAGDRLKAIRKDGRYAVAREFHGEGDASWVARFCEGSGSENVIYAVDGSSGTFGCSTKLQAVGRCYSHNWNRMKAHTPKPTA